MFTCCVTGALIGYFSLRMETDKSGGKSVLAFSSRNVNLRFSAIRIQMYELF